jgi:O-antigen ligase
VNRRASSRAPRRVQIGKSLSRMAGADLTGSEQRLVASGLLAVVILMLFGGGIPALFTTVLFATVGFLMLGCLALNPDRGTFSALPLPLRLAIVAIAILPLLQLVPLPPAIWHALPGQELRSQTLALAGLENSWQPLSVTPLLTARTAAIAITFVALLLTVLALPKSSIPLLATVVLGVVGLNIVVGLIQVVSGGQALQFHRAADHRALIGFYANKNHAGLVLALSMPLAAYVFGSRAHPRGTRTWLALYAVVALVAIVTTNSRAGLGLGLLAAFLLAPFYVRSTRPAYVVAALAALFVGGILVSMTGAFEQVSSRFNVVDEDLRWQFLRTSWAIIDRYWIWGSGIGSFSTLYAVYENLAWVKPTYVNQLHNDYLQLVLEAGVPGVLALLALVVGCAWRGWHVWSTGSHATRLPLIYGGIMLLLIGLHSFADYPLRRPAVLPLLAIALVLVLRGDLFAATGLPRGKQRA